MLTKKSNKPSREYINSLERALTVLKCFSSENPELTISDIAAITKFNTAVVRRYLHTFLHLGYIGQVGKRFILRPTVMSLGSAYLDSMHVEVAFRPALQELTDRTGDSSSLSVLLGKDIVFLVYVSTAPTIQDYVGVGKKFPAFVAAMGRAILAHRPLEEVELYLSTLKPKRYTEKTVASTAALRKVLATTREQGYSCVEGELDPNIVSLAVPIRTARKEVVAAINCSTSIAKADKKTMIETRLPLLLEAARKIEDALIEHPQLGHSITCSR